MNTEAYEEIQPAKFAWKRMYNTVVFNPDFDDFKQVQKFLMLKRAINRGVNNIFAHGTCERGLF